MLRAGRSRVRNPTRSLNFMNLPNPSGPLGPGATQPVTETSNRNKKNSVALSPHVWSSGQSSWLLTKRSRIRFPALPYFLSSSGSGTGSTQPL
jgi:hypothetical protein